MIAMFGQLPPKKKINNYIIAILSLGIGILSLFTKYESPIVMYVSRVITALLFFVNIMAILEISFFKKSTLEKGQELLEKLNEEIEILTFLNDPNDPEKYQLLNSIKEKYRQLKELLEQDN